MFSGRTLIITRMTTQNAGNEALSKELINYVTQKLPELETFALDRYPRFFEQFTLDSLGSDPASAFDAIVRNLIANCMRPGVGSLDKANEARVRLDPRGRELGGPLRRLKRSIAIRRRLATRGLIEREDPVRAVTACATADLVIWNPAGEMGAGVTAIDHVVRLLLLIGVAQASGRKTAVVNHSLEVTDPRLRKLVAHVYSRCDYVGFRDPRSVEAALSIGVRPDKIVESPDLVFLAARRPAKASPPDAPQDAIVVALNGGMEVSAPADDWRRLASGLGKFGRPLLFLSNAVNHDRLFATRLRANGRKGCRGRASTRLPAVAWLLPEELGGRQHQAAHIAAGLVRRRAGCNDRAVRLQAHCHLRADRVSNTHGAHSRTSDWVNRVLANVERSFRNGTGLGISFGKSSRTKGRLSTRPFGLYLSWWTTNSLVVRPA